MIYHWVDFDGIVSAAIVGKFVGDSEYIPWNYGDKEVPDVREGDKVYMVDISMDDFSLMAGWNDIAELVWIDHHASAIRRYNEYLNGGGKPIKGFRQESDEKAAAAFTWSWFTDEPMPRFVELVSSYDVWNHYCPDVVDLQAGLSLLSKEDRIPSSGILQRLVSGDEQEMTRIIEDGRIVSKYRSIQNEGVCRAQAFSVHFEGLEFLAANSRGGSMVFDSMWRPELYDAMLLFWLDSSMTWQVSMYSPKEKEFDLSTIAVKYGGGGHPHACGFRCSKLPEELVRQC